MKSPLFASLALAATCLFAAAETHPFVPQADEPELCVDADTRSQPPADGLYRYTVSFTDHERGTVERRSFRSRHEYMGKSSYCCGQLMVFTASDWEDSMALAVVDWSRPDVIEEEWLFDLKAHKAIRKVREDSYRLRAKGQEADAPYIVWHQGDFHGTPQGLSLQLGEVPRDGCTLTWHYDAATGTTRIEDSSQPADRQPELARRARRLAWEDVSTAPAPKPGPAAWNTGTRFGLYTYRYECADEESLATLRRTLEDCRTLELSLGYGSRQKPLWTHRVQGAELRAVLDRLAAVPQWYTRRKMSVNLSVRIHPSPWLRSFRFLDAKGQELPLPELLFEGENGTPDVPINLFPYPPRPWDKFLPRRK